MAATSLLHTFFPSIHSGMFTKSERQTLEALILVLLYRQLSSIYTEKQQIFMEDRMIGGIMIKTLMTDLLVNKDYSMEGLASYTGYPVDVILDVISGINLNPTITLSIKVIELHALSRRNFYEKLLQKLIESVIE